MSKQIKKSVVIPDTWESLKTFTNARIALGRAGVALPLKEVLQFRLSHALARQAVYSALRVDDFSVSLKQFQLPVITVKTKAGSRAVYLQRPDYGRQLNILSAKRLKEENSYPADVLIILADGLSATAINDHAVPVLQILVPLLLERRLSIAPIIIAEQARVALGDRIGPLLKTKLSLVLIGERPGLSSSDSMGAYITYQPSPGLTDESRNCISNIHPAGLSYEAAAGKIASLIQSSLQLKLSGIELKEELRVKY